ncbi:LOW QUALITY PROTEIN: hypothetical protein ACHAW6_015277 [Cyclotella cf. meneghiniana]
MVDQKMRKNVKNLGMYAMLRDDVTNGTVSLEKLAELTLNVLIDEILQTSTWGTVRSSSNYAAIDATASLKIYEVLQKMPDLSQRWSKDDAKFGTKVDLIPLHWSITCMATRAATGIILEKERYECHEVNIGKHTYVVLIKEIYAPALIVAGCGVRDGKSALTLGDLGK